MSVALDICIVPDESAPRTAQRPRRLYAVPPVAPPAAHPAHERPVSGRSVVALRPPVGRDAVAPVRLTRRGVIALALLVATLGTLIVWWASASAPTVSPAPAAPAAVTVHAGDTVWSIAARYAGTQDPRAVANSIESLNHLSDATVTPGQVLRLR